jgi:hypothetical protein
MLSHDPAVGGGRDAPSRLPPRAPRPPLRLGNYAAAMSCTGSRISLVRVTSCHPRLLRCLPVGPGRYRGYRGGRRTRSCPARTATADQLPSKQLLLLPFGSRTTSSRSCHISKIWCPLDRAVQKTTCDGGCGTISPPIAPPPPPCPPLGLLLEPHRDRVT